MTNHLVILKSSSLDKIVRGEKTIESRFGINRPPASKTEAGDLLYLKETHGDIRATARVTSVECFEFSLPYELIALEPQFWQGVHGTNHRNLRYWLDAVKRGVRYAVFIHLENVQPLRIPAAMLPRNLPYASAWIRDFEPPDVKQPALL